MPVRARGRRAAHPRRLPILAGDLDQVLLAHVPRLVELVFEQLDDEHGGQLLYTIDEVIGG
jgi:hypothetical protein